MVSYPEADAKFIAVSTGYGHTATVKDDGYIWSYGKNDYGQLGNEDVVDSAKPVLAGSRSMKITPAMLTLPLDTSASVDLTTKLTVSDEDALNLLLNKEAFGDYRVESLTPSVLSAAGTSITTKAKGTARIKIIKDKTGTIGYVTVVVTDGSAVPMVVSGSGHTAALKADGTHVL